MIDFIKRSISEYFTPLKYPWFWAIAFAVALILVLLDQQP